jgi:two-component SAPR family response regulator
MLQRIRDHFLVIFLLILTCSHNGKVYSQIHGLGFYSYGVSKDLRTGLNLNPEKPLTIKDELELSFSFMLKPDESMYFGYVFRFITDDINIDLIFNYDDNDNTSFTLVQGQKLLLKHKTDFRALSSDWNTFHFIFDIRNSKISVNLSDTIINVGGSVLKRGDRARLFFGLCDYENLKTTDVPAMNVKDIKITINNKIIHNWPLDELSGNSARDIAGSLNASVVQPLWLKSEHNNWKELFTLESEGYSQVAFDKNREEIIIVGQKEILRYSVKNRTATSFIPKNFNSNLLSHRQSLYDNQTDLLYSLDIDKQSVSEFDFNNLTWSKDLEPGLPESDFEHYNKYFSPSENSVYYFGGYGHHKYKNQVQRYDINSGKMELLHPTGDYFNPRYLGALGELNDTIYILGGFGSTTGDQIYNPRCYYDLMAFSPKNRSFSKKFEMPPLPEDYVFSNSMIINPADRSYFVLAFPVFKYDGYLQLIQGSLDKPVFTYLGSRIPYQFLDIVSFSDLYFCSQNKKIIAVTLQNEEGKSRLKIYSLGFPPDKQTSGYELAEPDNRFLKFIPVILSCFFILIVTLFYILRKKKRRTPEKITEDKTPKSGLQNIVSRGEFCTIHFFGDFQVINSAGVDTTRKFTPLLKELFLLIWFNSIKNDMGISNEKIIEILWPGFSESSANNNKAVNIAKLRAILTRDLWSDLSFKETGYWKIEYKNKHIINDYYDFIKITSVKTELSKPDMLKLIEIGHKGTLLSNLKYKWLDEFKEAVANELINRLVRYERNLNIKDQPEHVIQVADAILNQDSLNEEALASKCKAFIVLGRHSVAKEVYDHFSREYRSIYNADYSKSFTTIANLE